MAEYLASIFGTEKDKVNCSFYFKIGACRHGDRCSRIHNKPTFSQTVLLQNLYHNPQNSAQSADGSHLALVTDEEMQEHFDNFFEDVFVELEDKEYYDNFFEDVFVELDDKYGEIEEMNVCDNLGDHLVGNVYIKFRNEEDAERAVNDLNNRWFGGRPVYAELSPVTDFREACCRQYEMGECTRSGFCNFMHLKPISRELRRELYGRRRKGGTGNPNSTSAVRQGSRSPSPRERDSRRDDRRGGRGGRDGGGGGGRDGGGRDGRDGGREGREGGKDRRRSRSRERTRREHTSRDKSRSKSHEREGRSGRF